MSTPTAAKTIISALDDAGYLCAASGHLHSVRCPRTGLRLTAPRDAQAAVFRLASKANRAVEVAALRHLVETLQVAGYAARRGLDEVRASWATCAKRAQEAA